MARQWSLERRAWYDEFAMLHIRYQNDLFRIEYHIERHYFERRYLRRKVEACLGGSWHVVEDWLPMGYMPSLAPMPSSGAAWRAYIACLPRIALIWWRREK